jgi:CSLREA domain-containing protein
MHPLKILATTVGAALLVWGLLCAYASSPAWAATITVNSLADDTDGTDGDCTLREAIISANTDTRSGTAAGECAAGSGADLIDIGVSSGTVNLTGALPNLASNIAIEGSGADKFTVRRDSGGDYRIFTVACCEVSISRITITNGKDFGTGGGIFNNGGTLTITGSTISGNSANQGGGIYNFEGTLTITGSTISGNSASFGGGVFSNLLAGEVGTTITNSTISGNSASEGGGVYSNTALSGPKTTITNSTISGNSATVRYGGGVYNGDGLTVIEHSTITDNTAPNGKGSGVASYGDSRTSTEVLSSIVSANTNTDVDFVDDTINNSFDSNGYNLIGDGNATGAFNQTGDQTGVSDPKLKVLGNYGGPTQTHSLKPGSPAINAIPSATNGCGTDFTTDQRGVLRPQGGNCEIGSFEDKSPWVKKVVPQEEATGVDSATNVEAVFSEKMRDISIDVSAFKLYKAGTTTPIGAAVSYDAVAKRAILNPDANLELGVRYKAVLTTGAKDRAGNKLDQDQNPSNGNQPKVWFFTVRN